MWWHETAFAIIKESGGWLCLKWMLVKTEFIKMNKSCTPSETFCGGLEFESWWEQKHYIKCLWADSLGHKEKILKTQDNFLA